MPAMTPQPFAQIVEAAASARSKVRNVRIGGYSVIDDIVARSGKSAQQWCFTFDVATGDYKYSGAFPAANEPSSSAMQRQGIEGLTGR